MRQEHGKGATHRRDRRSKGARARKWSLTFEDDPQMLPVLHVRLHEALDHGQIAALLRFQPDGRAKIAAAAVSSPRGAHVCEPAHLRSGEEA